MKKTITLFLSLLFFAHIISAQPQKVVLIEEGTGAWCQWCPRGDIYAQELQKNYPGQFVFIAVHSGDPMEYVEYDEALNFSGIPAGWIDRTYISELGPFTDLYQDMDGQLALVPPAGISVSTDWDATTREITITIEAEFFENLNGDFRLAAVVVEDGVTGPAPNFDQSNSYSGGGAGPMGGYEDLPSPVSASIMVYNHVARHLPGGFEGDINSLPNSISAGENHAYVYQYILPDEFNEEYVHIIGLLVNADNGRVLNAGKSNYLPGYENAKPFFHYIPQGTGFIGLNYKYDIVTHDPEHDDLTITNISNLPPGLELIDLSDGFAELIGVPTELGIFDVTLNVNDGEWDVEQFFQITINEPTEDWIQVGEAGFNNFEPAEIDIEINSGGVPYVMATNSDLDQAVLYKFENGNWEQIGNPLPANAFHTSMALGPDDVPYIFTDAVVSKWNGNEWEQVGNNIPGADFIFTDIIVADDGHIFTVHFAPPSTTVSYLYDGTEWQPAGNITDGAGVWNRFHLDNNGQPILIYGTDGSSIAYSEVTQWDGTGWNQLGEYIEPNSQTYFDHDMAMTSNGEIYAALTIGVGEQKLNIYQLMDNEWQLIAEDLAGGATESCNMEADSDGNIIVAFRDEENGGRTSAMKYDGNEWTFMGLPGFTAIASRHSLALDPSGIPYVAYRDADASEWISVKKFEDLTSPIFSPVDLIENINIYPNPNDGQFILEYEEGEFFEIYAVDGQLIKRASLKNNNSHKGIFYENIEIEGLGNGVYFLRILGGDKIGTAKFIID